MTIERALIGTADGSASDVDPYFANVSLLLHGDGTNGAQNNTFLDSSTNNFTITRNGNTTQGTFSPFNTTTPYSPTVNGGSGYFDGSGDWLDAGSQTAFAFGTGNFTVEGWIFATAASDSPIYEGRANGNASDGFTLTALSPSVIRIFSGSALISSSGTSYLNQWTHVAVCRVSGTTALYINGVSVGTTTSLGNNPTGNAVVGGGRYSPGTAITNSFSGYISNFRLVKGTAVYTSNFTPPTAPLTAITNTSLLCNFTNAGIFDNAAKNDLETVGNAQISTSVKKYGTGSIYIPLDSSRVATSPNVGPGFKFGTERFTVECWVYIISAPPNAWFLSAQPSTGWANASGAWIFGYNFGAADSKFALLMHNGTDVTNISLKSAGTFSSGLWHHIAFAYDGVTLRLFINGNIQASWVGSINNNPAPNQLLSVSSGYDIVGARFNGYIDDLRITKGVARYTANFTPPTQAFPNQ